MKQERLIVYTSFKPHTYEENETKRKTNGLII